MTKQKTNFWCDCVSPVECLADFFLATCLTIAIGAVIASLIE